jgi:hypothetical protein
MKVQYSEDQRKVYEGVEYIRSRADDCWSAFWAAIDCNMCWGYGAYRSAFPGQPRNRDWWNASEISTSHKKRSCKNGLRLIWKYFILMGYGLEDRGSRVRFPAGAGNFSLHHRVRNGSGAHPASYPMGTGSSFPVGKAAGAWSWPLTSI